MTCVKFKDGALDCWLVGTRAYIRTAREARLAGGVLIRDYVRLG